MYRFIRNLFLGIILFPIFIFSQFTDDAAYLTISLQPEELWINSDLAETIDGFLEDIRATDDTLNYIHVYPPFDLNNILLFTDAPWAESWKDNDNFFHTGNEYIDNLCSQLGLRNVDYNDLFFALNFRSIFNPSVASELFLNSNDIAWAEPNYWFGDGNDIDVFIHNNNYYFILSFGYGDCIAGCINHEYHYFQINENGEIASFDNYTNQNIPQLFPFNFPNNYEMTMFENLDEILNLVQNGQYWWERRHPIEGIYRFFTCSNPWASNDYYYKWYNLQDEVYSRRNEIRTVLQNSLNDEDDWVVASAEKTLGVIPEVYVDSITVEISNDTVFVYDYNAWEQCAFELDYTIAIDSSEIVVTQIDTAQEMTTCYGYHNFITPIVGLAEGNFTVHIHRISLGQEERFIKLFNFDYFISANEDGNNLSTEFKLFQNYPNPFSTKSASNGNPTTTIKFSIPNVFARSETTKQSDEIATQPSVARNDNVRLVVYNSLGQQIAELINRPLTEGNYEVKFDGTNLPSGIYFYRLQSGNFIQTKKMILLK